MEVLKLKKFIFILSFFSLLFTGCFSSNNYTNSIYSNDEKIIAEGDSFYLNLKNQKLTDDSLTASCVFNGIDTIWQYNADSDLEVDLTYGLTLTKGKAKLVFIDGNNKITNIVERTEKYTDENTAIAKLNLKKGINRIKLVAADKPDLNLNLSIDVGDLEGLGLS